MNWRPPAAKVNVVSRYLMARFPGTTITHDTDFDTMSEFFNAAEQKSVRYRAAIARRVFDDLTESEIDALLVRHNLATRMRDAAPNRVTLDAAGISGPDCMLDDAERRRRIRMKLDTGQLPTAIPHGVRRLPGDVEASVVIGMGGGQPCLGCGEPIAPAEVQLTYGTLRFHEKCDAVWREEAQRVRPPR